MTTEAKRWQEGILYISSHLQDPTRGYLQRPTEHGDCLQGMVRTQEAMRAGGQLLERAAGGSPTVHVSGTGLTFSEWGPARAK